VVLGGLGGGGLGGGGLGGGGLGGGGLGGGGPLSSEKPVTDGRPRESTHKTRALVFDAGNSAVREAALASATLWSKL
jgi:hypothetical protein